LKLQDIYVCVDSQINGLAGIKSLQSNFNASSDELNLNIICGSATNIFKQVPIKHFHPDSEQNLNF
jgi:hypothetical protein